MTKDYESMKVKDLKKQLKLIQDIIDSKSTSRTAYFDKTQLDPDHKCKGFIVDWDILLVTSADCLNGDTPKNVWSHYDSVSGFTTYWFDGHTRNQLDIKNVIKGAVMGWYNNGYISPSDVHAIYAKIHFKNTKGALYFELDNTFKLKKAAKSIWKDLLDGFPKRD